MKAIAYSILLHISCKKDKRLKEEWSIPNDEIQDGGPGKDGIPSIDNPKFIVANDVSYLKDNDLIVGIKIDNEVKAYPHIILDWHEIVNDNIGNIPLSIIYCPLTGTATGWNRKINGVTTSFGVSGLLYNSNIIPYDRNSDSNWSQMLQECVNGSLIGQKPKTHHLVETTWKTWKKMYPNSSIMTTNTGSSRNYGQYPYGDYKTNDNKLIFPISHEDNRLPKKSRVLGILTNEEAKVYPLSSFGVSNQIIQDQSQRRNIIVVGNKSDNFIVAYETPNDSIIFEPVQDSLPIIMKDNNGIYYDVFGINTDGEKLKEIDAFIGYWFAFGTFYPSTIIYKK